MKWQSALADAGHHDGTNEKADAEEEDRLLDDVLAETLGQIDRLELVTGKICQIRKIPLSQTARQRGPPRGTAAQAFPGRFIVAHRRCEHVYTLLHEVGHYLLHFKRIKPRRLSPWYLNINWKIDAVADIAAKVRRGVRLVFRSEKGKEWEADLWAMCGFVYLKKFGADTDLTAFLKRHPEKRWIYRFVAAIAAYTEIKKPIAAGFKLLCKAWRGLSDLLSRLKLSVSIPS